MPDESGAVRQAVLRWWCRSGVPSKRKLSAALILARVLGTPALSFLALPLWAVLAQDGAGCSLCPHCSQRGPWHACCLALCSSQLRCSALQLSLQPICWQSAQGPGHPGCPLPGYHHLAPVTAPLLGPASLSLPPDSPDSSFPALAASWPLTASVPTAGCPRGSRGMCVEFVLQL